MNENVPPEVELTLDEADAGADPIALFTRWFQEAAEAGAPLPEAMALATATPDGRPSCRFVLLKGCGEHGFQFYTNRESRKAGELDANARAALTFHWAALERQVRIEGTVERGSDADADEYFASRPREKQIGAWASAQSREIPGREALEEAAVARAAEFAGRDVPRPPHWGGYVVRAEAIEFWQGRGGRMHDRLLYERTDGGWRRRRLAP